MMQTMQWFDIIIVGAVLILGIKGALNGLIKEVFGLIGLVGGLIIASRFKDIAASFIQDNVYRLENVALLDFVAFISTWLIFWLVCLLIGKFLAKLVGVSGLGFLDKIGGFVAGSGKIFLVLAAVLAFASTTNLDSKISPYFKDSKVYPILLDAGKWLANIDVNAIKNSVTNTQNNMLQQNPQGDDVSMHTIIQADDESKKIQITIDNNVTEKIQDEFEKFVTDGIKIIDDNKTQGENDGN